MNAALLYFRLTGSVMFSANGNIPSREEHEEGWAGRVGHTGWEGREFPRRNNKRVVQGTLRLPSLVGARGSLAWWECYIQGGFLHGWEVKASRT